LLTPSFTFVVRDESFTTSLSVAIALSPSVELLCGVDSTCTQFTITDPKIIPSSFPYLFNSIPSPLSHRNSLVKLCRFLGNPELECHYFCSNAPMTFSNLQHPPPFHLTRVTDLSLLSPTAADSLLSRGSVSFPSEDALFDGILLLGEAYDGLLRYVRSCFLSPDAFARYLDYLAHSFPTEFLFTTFILTPFPRSLILPYSRLRTNIFDFCHFGGRLLWRGSRDGFTAAAFHRNCDGVPNTVTIVRDTHGNIFGGFTPLPWSGPEEAPFLPDDTCKSFVFTIKNPLDRPARKFKLLPAAKQFATICGRDTGPGFGGAFVIGDTATRKGRTEPERSGASTREFQPGENRDSSRQSIASRCRRLRSSS
jgi:hypothetical protein